MNFYSILGAVLIAFYSISNPNYDNPSKKAAHTGRCTGSANCRACSSCNYCGHCNSGGSCGVCGGGGSLPESTTKLLRKNVSKSTSSNRNSSSTVFCQVSADVLNVRKGPGIDYSIIAEITEGEFVTATFMNNSTWARITFSISGVTLTGYVSKAYISKL